jgi:hypothetical protein
MPITTLECAIFRTLHAQGQLPSGANVLELGAANWYGDEPIEVLQDDIYRYGRPARRKDIFLELDRIQTAGNASPSYLFDITKVVYKVFLDMRAWRGISPRPTPGGEVSTFNVSIDLREAFDFVFNDGLGAQLFNREAFFRTCHDACRPGGIMLHSSTFTGYVDHGFSNAQPTMYLDLAVANAYDVLGLFVANHASATVTAVSSPEQLRQAAGENKLPQNSLLYAVFRKSRRAPFVIPALHCHTQGIRQ